MREILFKAKRLDNGEWVEGFLCKHPSAIQIGETSPWYIHVPPVDPDDKGGVFNVYPNTVCQYTGITDKNGVKIFEGDNIIHDTKYLIEEKRFDTGTVVFDEQTAQFVRASKDERGLFEIWKRSKNDYEVIGNIHD